MADYRSPTVVNPVIPVENMTSLERLLLEAVFDVEFDEDETAMYFYSELGPNAQITVDRDQLQTAFRESAVTPKGTAAEHVADLCRSSAGSDERKCQYLDIDMSEPVWPSILQDIVRRAQTINEIVVTTSYTCSRMRPDGFGGAVMLITADTIARNSTSRMIEGLRAEAARISVVTDLSTAGDAITGPETRTLVVISTGHICPDTRTMLEHLPCGKWPCVGGGYADYGWFFYAHEDNCGVADQRIPEDLYAIMTWARKRGASHVLLDRDGDQVDDLEWFDW